MSQSHYSAWKEWIRNMDDENMMIGLDNTWGASFEDMEESYIEFLNTWKKEEKTDLRFFIFHVAMISLFVVAYFVISIVWWIAAITTSLMAFNLWTSYKVLMLSRKNRKYYQQKLENKERG